MAGVACNGGSDGDDKVVDSQMPVDTGTGTPTPVPMSDEFERVDCMRTLAEPPQGQTCAVTGDPDTATQVIVRGDVLGNSDVYLQGEIRFALGLDNATIECVGCDCSTSEDVVVLDCPDAVVSPGLVNAHDHIRYADETVKETGEERYDHRHDWRRGTRNHTSIGTSSNNDPEATLYGELRMLFGGATSIAGSISSVNASGLLRNLDNGAYNEGLNPGDVDYSTFPLGDAGFGGSPPILEDERCEPYSPESSSVLNNEIYLPHVAEGIDLEARNEFACLSGQRTAAVDYVADNTSIVHGIALTAQDVAIVASRGAQLVWSPRSNLALYGDTANVVTYDRFDVPIALGTDWVPSGSATMLRELACADHFNREHLGGYFSDFALWQMATLNGAIAMGVEDQLGALEPGYIADVAIFANAGQALHGAVVRGDLDTVALVFRGGRPLTGEAALVEGLVPSAAFGDCEALAECVSDHVVCVDRPGFTLASIEGGVRSNAHDLYICGEPDREPSCEPFRNNESGDGVIYPTSSTMDTDLDGEDDDVDNCPTIFNPRRPLDGWIQADLDGDGDGDACDVCPLFEGDDCPIGDIDGDGVLDGEDNCPRDPNPTQADADGDGIGAACDACDDFANERGACQQSVYDVKQGALTGALVVLEDLVITAVTSRSYFAQLDPSSPDYAGPDFSGVFVFSQDTAGQVAVGDVITIEAGVQDFFGQLQLSDVVAVQVTSSGAPLPAPVVATPDEVRTSGSRAAALEASLVSVLDVEVTEVDLAPGPGDSAPTGEFRVDGLLRVNDLLYAITPAPEVGDTFDVLTGVLRFGNNDSKLEPRGEFDVAFGDPEVESVVLAQGVAVELGALETMTARLRSPSSAVQTVGLTCLPAGLLDCPASVDVPVGQVAADFDVTGLQVGTVTVTASLGASSADVTLQVYDDATTRQVVDLTPNPLTLPPSTPGTLTATIDLPAPAGGLDLPVIASAGLTAPSTVTVPEGALAVDFDVSSPTEATYTVDVDGVSTTVEVSAVPAGTGLAFWEYTEPRSGGVDSLNKFVEIKNLEATPFDLTGCRVDEYVNGQTTPNSSRSYDLNPVTLPAGGIYLVCPNPDPNRIAIGGSCDQERNMQHNGDDTFVLSCGGVVMDVLGEIGFDPGTQWGDASLGTESTTLRRDCGVLEGDTDGSDVFDPAAEWTQVADDADGSNLGLDHCP